MGEVADSNSIPTAASSCLKTIREVSFLKPEILAPLNSGKLKTRNSESPRIVLRCRSVFGIQKHKPGISPTAINAP
jgi:hypothetical protein